MSRLKQRYWIGLHCTVFINEKIMMNNRYFARGPHIFMSSVLDGTEGTPFAAGRIVRKRK